MQLDILNNISDVPIRKPALLPPAYVLLTREMVLGKGTSWSRLQRELSRRRKRERKTTSSGMTNCLASGSASLVRASAATLSSIEQVVAHVATPLGFTEPGHQRLHAERQRCNSVGSLGVMIPSKIASSITRRSL